MKILRIITVFIALLIIPVLCLTQKSRAKDISLDSVSAVVIDQNSGRILYSKNGDKTLAMASTTKIITCIVALEKGKINDTVTVSRKAASVGGSSARLKAGEKISLEELLYGLMLRSGNDAAVAIAEHIGGTVEGFVSMMNEKAFEIGAYNTSFITPHGLDADEHYTTSNDLAKITAYAMRNEIFSKIVSTKDISSGLSGTFNRTYSNINKFIYQMEDADGVKTGYTGNAGKCLVASVKHSYGRYICVVLNSSDRWKDAEELVNYAREKYKYIKVFDKDELLKKLKVYGGNQKFLDAKVKEDLYLPVENNEMQTVSMELYVPTVLFSPIKENEIIGNVVALIGGVVVAKYPIVSNQEVKTKKFIDMVKDIFLNY